MTVVIVLLCGLPGAGKSTISAHIVSESRKRSFKASVVSFDDFVTEDWNQTSFKEGREKGLSILSNLVQAFNEKPASDAITTVIIVDDIMYLKSMRRKVYVVARDNNCPLITVLVDAELRTILERNAARHGKARIEQSVIHKIHSNFENPCSSMVFDRHNLVIRTDQKKDSEQLISPIFEMIEKVRILHKNELALKDENLNIYIPKRSIVKLLDNAIREEISKIMKKSVFIYHSDTQVDINLKKKKIAKVLNETKSEFLKRAHSLKDDSNIIDEIIIQNEINKFREEVHAKVSCLDQSKFICDII